MAHSILINISESFLVLRPEDLEKLEHNQVERNANEKYLIDQIDFLDTQLRNSVSRGNGVLDIQEGCNEQLAKKSKLQETLAIAQKGVE